MSADGPGTREVAHRVFAAEFDDASLSYSESDEERAPNYVVTPTGARVNRLFVAGVLTEVERVNDETRRGRVVDPSGAFVTYAGQYQPEAQTFLERADPPAFVALTGKARTFEPEDSDRVFTSVRPESLNEVDADTRDRWVVSAAEATLDRLAVFAAALDSPLRGDDLRAALEAGGAPTALADGVPRAIAHYDTSTAYVEAVRRLAVDALELVAGDRDEVRAPEFAPDDGDDAAIGPLPETDVTIDASADAGVEATAEGGSADTEDTETRSEVSEPETAVSEGAESGGEADATEAVTPAEETTPSSDDPGLGDFDAGTDGTELDDAVADAGDRATVDSSTGDETPTDETMGGDESDAAVETDDMYELDDDEREAIESEYGTDFSTGTEVDEPGEADIDVPDPDEVAEEATDGSSAAVDGDSSDDGDDLVGDSRDGAVGSTDASGDKADSADDDAGDGSDGEVNLETAVVDVMTELDDGDGAGREDVIDAVVDEHGTARDEVEDAIRDALMSGKCYEPGDGVLKPI
ncbi:RPA family protein [Halorubrum laminariae]|uniref:Rpa-associated protein n=1 Tax=Halorubrum laminariae TaxID=1433523 RepID=A0ABD6C049_9EURY|nr:hypothetical protein [Halorubrum laminariae]